MGLKKEILTTESWIFIFLGVFWIILLNCGCLASWMYLGIASLADSLHDDTCNEVPGLVHEQLQVCKDNPQSLLCISEGAKRGILECQNQFKFERWNCTTHRNFTVFGPVLKKGTRETAFVYAVLSAGLVHSVTQACSVGNLTDCSCDMSRRRVLLRTRDEAGKVEDLLTAKRDVTFKQFLQLGVLFVMGLLTSSGTPNVEDQFVSFILFLPFDLSGLGDPPGSYATAGIALRYGEQDVDGWKWGGCSDNVNYGLWFSRTFVDATETVSHEIGPSVRGLMNLHNNEVGRKAVETLMSRRCRCHGVSGSCAVKTCWRGLPAFKDVGQYLKESYEKSVRLAGRSKSKLRRKEKSKRLVPISHEELVHLSKSPNYCSYNNKRGILGTTGRECNRSSLGSESCNLLCCGRGYNTQVVRHVERCRCKFHWCCFVECKTCETLVDIHTCK